MNDFPLLIAALGGLALMGGFASLAELNNDYWWKKILRSGASRALSNTFAGPLVWIARWERKKVRRLAAFYELPDFLDLLGLTLSTGLNLESAWALSVTYLKTGPFTKELQSVQTLLRLGRSGEEALRELSARVGDASLSMIFSLLIQSLKRGSPLQEILHDQADAMRKSRMIRMEKKAQTAGLRLLFPLLVFIFPTLFLILFAPLAIRISQGGGLF